MALFVLMSYNSQSIDEGGLEIMIKGKSCYEIGHKMCLCGNCTQPLSDNAVLGEVEPFKKTYNDGSFNVSCQCGYLFLHSSFKYCPECGGKLSWRNFA